jgi:hypothetical protein
MTRDSRIIIVLFVILAALVVCVMVWLFILV